MGAPTKPERKAISKAKGRIGLGFFAALLLLSIIAIGVRTSLQRGQKHRASVDQTYLVISVLQDILSQTKDVHSAQRGYVLTGQREYLTPYDIAAPKIEEDYRLLDQLVADNRPQQDRLHQLKITIDQRLALAAQIVAAYDEKGEAAALVLVRAGTGKREMDNIRAEVSAMIEVERHLLDLRQRAVEETDELSGALALAGLAACGIVIALVFLLVHRQHRLRNESERSLQRSLEKLQTISNENALTSSLGDYLQSCQKPEEAFVVLERMLPSLFPSLAGYIGIFDGARESIEPVAKWGSLEPAAEVATSSCWALRRGQLHCSRADSTEPPCDHLAAATRANGAALCVPMIAHGENLGLLYVEATRHEDLGEHVSSLARRVGEQVSLAVSSLRTQRRMWEQSVRDALTGLFNRRYLEPTLERELARAARHAQPVSALMLDLDFFKRVNDQHGHEAGDALLRAFAQLLRDTVRTEDVACRYGGEEFLVMLPGCSLEDATDRAEQICAAVRTLEVQAGDGTIGNVTVSIGVATSPLHGKRPELLMRAADAALYRAKREGRDRVVAADAIPSSIRLTG